MNKLFKLIQGEVKYPTWCPRGFVLKEVGGDREYPVDQHLGNILFNKVGQELEENIDFEVIHRVMENDRSSDRKALICNQGEIAGGGVIDGEWHLTMIEKGEDGKQKKFKAKDLTPVQFAQLVESPKYLKDIQWRKVEKEFSKVITGLSDDNRKRVVDWFKNNPLIKIHHDREDVYPYR
jgi:hypothetical protein